TFSSSLRKAPRPEWMSAEATAIARLINGVAWLIPYCARHHPLQSEKQRVPGTPSTSFSQGGGRLGWPSLRASTEHSIRLGPEPIDPECAVREHKGQPCRPPLSPVCATREHVRPPALQAPLVLSGLHPHVHERRKTIGSFHCIGPSHVGDPELEPQETPRRHLGRHEGGLGSVHVQE